MKEQPGLEPAPVWDAGATCSGYTSYATAPALLEFQRQRIAPLLDRWRNWDKKVNEKVISLTPQSKRGAGVDLESVLDTPFESGTSVRPALCKDYSPLQRRERAGELEQRGAQNSGRCVPDLWPYSHYHPRVW